MQMHHEAPQRPASFCDRVHRARSARDGTRYLPRCHPVPRACRTFDVGHARPSPDVADRGAGSRRPGAGPRLGQELLTRSSRARLRSRGGRGCAGRPRRSPSWPASTGLRSSSAISGTSSASAERRCRRSRIASPSSGGRPAEARRETAHRAAGDQLGRIEVGQRSDAEGDRLDELGQDAAEAERDDAGRRRGREPRRPAALRPRPSPARVPRRRYGSPPRARQAASRRSIATPPALRLVRAGLGGLDDDREPELGRRGHRARRHRRRRPRRRAGCHRPRAAGGSRRRRATRRRCRRALLRDGSAPARDRRRRAPARDPPAAAAMPHAAPPRRARERPPRATRTCHALGGRRSRERRRAQEHASHGLAVAAGCRERDDPRRARRPRCARSPAGRRARRRRRSRGPRAAGGSAAANVVAPSRIRAGRWGCARLASAGTTAASRSRVAPDGSGNCRPSAAQASAKRIPRPPALVSTATRGPAGQRLGREQSRGVEELRERPQPQHAGLVEERVDRRLGARERGRVRGRGARPRRTDPALEREHGLAARDAARDPPEALGIAEALEVERHDVRVADRPPNTRVGRSTRRPPCCRATRTTTARGPARVPARPPRGRARRSARRSRRSPAAAPLRRTWRSAGAGVDATPRQFGPIIRPPYERTSASSRSCRSAPSRPTSAKPAEITQSARTPLCRRILGGRQH